MSRSTRCWSVSRQGARGPRWREEPGPPGHLVHVPAGTRHNLVNAGPADLKLYTVYAPPQHAEGTIHRTRVEADASEGHY